MHFSHFVFNASQAHTNPNPVNSYPSYDNNAQRPERVRPLRFVVFPLAAPPCSPVHPSIPRPPTVKVTYRISRNTTPFANHVQINRRRSHNSLLIKLPSQRQILSPRRNLYRTVAALKTKNNVARNFRRIAINAEYPWQNKKILALMKVTKWWCYLSLGKKWKWIFFWFDWQENGNRRKHGWIRILHQSRRKHTKLIFLEMQPIRTIGNESGSA